ncbi:MAG TPA: DNA replication and repair protein RecF, partial [Ruminococcus sp.]|nr:DNA replication and repair protein RecF [Ruminococcus sp.]
RRRSFIDMAASQLNPVFVVHINKNNAIMNQRNALLKEIMQGNAPASVLEVWDRQAAHEGALISYMRNEYVGKINEICGRLYKTISGGSEELELEYKSNVFRPEDFEKPCGEEAFEQYYQKLRDNADYDIRTGVTHAGVNRDEILIKINGVSARDYGSQGQIKSAALVMKLAQAEIYKKRSKEAPVIFLDDVMGELDESRQRFVFDIIRGMQTFITTPNESALLPEIEGKIMRISQGKLTED